MKAEDPSRLCRLLSACMVLLGLMLTSSLAHAQWAPIGPDGGGAHLLASGDAGQGILVAGTRNALLYRSTDRAATWQPIPFDRSLSATLNALVASRCTPDEFYVGTGDPDVSRAGLYKLARSGGSWNLQPLMMGEAVMAISESPSNCRVLAAGTLSGVMVSRDSGATWRRVTPSGGMEAQPIVSLAFAPESAETMFAGTPRLPWKTIDGGQTWWPIHVGIYDDSDIFSIAIDKDRVLIGACSGIYRSGDGGVLWQKVLGIPGESRRTYIVKTDPSDPRTIYAGTSNGLWKSVNAGATWVQKSPVPARSIVIDPQNSRDVVMASDVGIWKSRNGGDTFTAANSGFVNRRVGAFLDLGGTLLASAVYEVGSGTLFATTDGGQNWTGRSGTSLFGEHIFHLVQGPGYLLAAGMEKVFRSRDGGKTWSRIPVALDGTLTDVAVVAGTRTILLATAKSIHASKDEGIRWRRISVPPGATRIEALRISSSGLTWGILSDGAVHLSRDHGGTWSPLSVAQESGPVYDFVVRDEQQILVGTLRGLLFTVDGGVQWNRPARGLPMGTVTSVLWHPGQEQLMFVVQNGTVWKSSSLGASWEVIGTSAIGRDEVSELHWGSGYEKLYAVGFARGVFVQSIYAPLEIALKRED